MTSKLFTEAHASLNSDIADNVTRVVNTLRGGDDAAQKNARNIEAESHHVGDSSWGDAKELSRLLNEVGSASAQSKGVDKIFAALQQVYLSACSKGLKIRRSHLPDRLLRYTTSRNLMLAVVEAMLGTKARIDFNSGAMTPQEAIDRLRATWDSKRLDGLGISMGRPNVKSVFATFAAAHSAPRNDARKMASALGLEIASLAPSPLDYLYELEYATDDVIDYRFPTIADAGGCPFFRPADEKPPSDPPSVDCWGWTEPLNGEAPQPEIVHSNESLSRLRGSPRLVGRMK